jgi:hypothetical protein
MKKIIAVFYALSFVALIVHPVLGQPYTQPSNDRKLNELSNRVASLDSSWGRFQIGGNFELETTSNVSNNQNTLGAPNITQELGISLNADIDPNLQLSVMVSQLGGWGLKYQSINSNNSPMTIPFQVDQAFLKLIYPTSIDYLGRFQFSLGPLGMMADFYANPVEGIALQKDFKKFHAIGIYSRVNTVYQSGTDQIESTDDYVAARIGWTNEKSLFGINIIPGLTGENGFSIDFSTNKPESKFAAELGYYSFSSKEFPDYKVDWTPGLLISYGKMISNKSYFQVKAGYMGPQFLPLYSSLAHSSGELREWFIPNSQGFEFYLQNGLTKGYALENRLILLTPIVNYNQPDINYRWRSCVVKRFSSVNQLQVGVDIKSFPDKDYHQLFLDWELRF